MNQAPLFQSFFLGGFECSCHQLQSGKRLDLLCSTGHERHAATDYQALQQHGISTARDGLRWHMIETSPYRYDFSSVLPMIHAARSTGTQVIWDLFHYGWPNDLDIFRPEFVHRFRAFAAAFTQLLADETDTPPFLSPVNEISYFAWAGGDAGYLNPFALERSFELKVQLVRATIEATEAIWDIQPEARIVHPDPVINVIPHPERPEEHHLAEGYRLAQYQAWDMLSGRCWPLLGGQEKYLDIIGLNYYNHNQWFYEGEFLDPNHPAYRPFSDILTEIAERYGRPLFIAETGMEGERRAGWLTYICDEVRAAMSAGVPVEGICLYPICDYPGWDDDRCCQTGLFGYVNETGQREVYRPLAAELQRQQEIFATFAPAQTEASQLDQASVLTTADSDLPAVCLITDSADPSGMGEHMLTLAAELITRYRILFVCPPGDKCNRFLERAEALGCAVLPLAVDGSRTAAKTLQWWLRELKVELVHAHAGIGWEGHASTSAAYEQGIPIVRTEHLPYLLTDPQQRAAHATLLPQIDQLICVSAEAMQSFIAAGVSAEKLTVVRNGIKPTYGTPDREGVRAEFGLAPDAQLVITVARLSEQKGHRYLLEAMPKIVAEAPQAHFLWVGQGPLERDLRHQMQQLAIDPSRLIWAGRRSDVPRLLAAADLFVLPSLFEGLPLVILEAMANGVPIVATHVCGTSEAIRDGWNGRLVEAKNSEALATAVIEALGNPALTARWSHAGRTRFEQEFSAARMADETAALYEKVRATRSHSPGSHPPVAEDPHRQQEAVAAFVHER